MTKKSKKDWKEFMEENDLQEESLKTEGLNEEEGPEEGALEHLSYEELEEKLTLAEQKAHENWEKSVRAMAELDNVRRRSERDVTNAHRYGLEKVVISLLPVVDSLEQALQLTEKHGDASMHEGLLLTMKLFTDVLEKNHVKALDPVGAAFDPQEHEAMSMQEVAGTDKNTVLHVVQKGYQLNDRVIRPARVIVAK